MTILLTGASGLVGGAFAKAALREGCHVVGIVGSFGGILPGVTEKRILDLAQTAAVEALIREVRPSTIVNAAAISEPARCESEPALAQRLNVDLPATLASLARETGARFVHLSSEQVFDGDRAPYSVSDPVSPINVYSRQKVESEQRVHRLAPQQAVTLRAPLLMGNSPGGKRSLHERLLLDWSAGRTPRLYRDEFRQTCTAENLAEAMLELCSRPEIVGVHHWAGSELLSRYEQGVRIRGHFKLREEKSPLIPVLRADDPAASARRQANLGLNVQPLASLLRTPVQSFAEQLNQLIVPANNRAWLETATMSATA